MKVLYITLLNSNAKNGGYVYRKAIGSALSNIVGANKFDIVTSVLDDSVWNGTVVYKMPHYDSGKQKLANLLCGNITQISKMDEKIICDLIVKNQYSVVVLGCSETGHLIKAIKKTGVRTITLYNDIIADAVKQKWSVERKLTYLPIAWCEKHAEKMDIKYSDIKVALNERDSLLMKNYWKKSADVLIPICLEDSFEESVCERKNASEGPLKLLFVGSYGWSVNVEGILWFCKEVMPQLPAEKVQLYIAGFMMEKIEDNPIIAGVTNVSVLGTVDDLAAEYAKVDVVVAPILSGTGMKTKTAEALMHGKYILGSREALEGFVELEDSLCSNSGQFVEKICYLEQNRPLRFISKNRQLYEDNYSVQAMEKQLRQVLYAEGK